MVVKPEPLAGLSDELMRLYRTLEDESEEVTRIFRSLQELSGMEEVYGALGKNRRQLEAQAWFAYQQSRALTQAVRWYGTCERRIKEEYEDAAICYPHNRSSVLDLSPVMEYLK